MVTKNDILNGKVIGELPDSNEQWAVGVTAGGVVFLVNNDHEPRVILYEKLVVVSSTTPQQELFNGLG